MKDKRKVVIFITGRFLGDLLKDLPRNNTFFNFCFKKIAVKTKPVRSLQRYLRLPLSERHPMNVIVYSSSAKSQMSTVITTQKRNGGRIPPGKCIGRPPVLNQLSLRVQPQRLQVDDRLSNFPLPISRFQNSSSSLE